MNLILRKAEIKDFDLIYTMICELEETEFDKLHFRESFIANIDNSSIFYFIAEYNEKPVGFISLSIQYHLHHAGKIGEIVEFFINKNMRSMGLGKFIISEIEKTAKENGCQTLELSSNKKRERAHKFYEREKFTGTHYKFVKILSAF